MGPRARPLKEEHDQIYADLTADEEHVNIPVTTPYFGAGYAAGVAALRSVQPVDRDHVEAWAALDAALDERDCHTVRTTTVRSRHWARAVGQERDAFLDGTASWDVGLPVPDRSVLTAVCAVRAGLARSDLYAVSRSSRIGSPHPETAAHRLETTAGVVLSFLSVRAMVGWVCADGAISDPGWQYGHVHDWAEAGLGEIGWLYAAAGFTLAETLAAKRSGALDPGQARLMAALRGVTLPVE